MRFSRPVSLVVLLTATSCSAIPGLEDPAFSVSPYYAYYELRGRTRMQSSSGGSIVNNAAMDVERLGLKGGDDDVGAFADFGDGFSGLRLHYFRLDHTHSDKGILTADWGNLDAGDQVRSSVEMDEVRLNYTGEIVDFTFPLRDQDVDVQLGLGGTLAHRDMTVRVQEDTAMLRQEQVEIADDGVFYPTARLRASWQGVALTADYAYSHDMDFGGAFDGTLQDLELTLSYSLDFQQVTFFGGYRRSELPASTSREPFAVDADFVLSGYFLGLGFEF